MQNDELNWILNHMGSKCQQLMRNLKTLFDRKVTDAKMTINALVGHNVVVFPGSRDVGNAAILQTVQLGSVAGQIVTNHLRLKLLTPQVWFDLVYFKNPYSSHKKYPLLTKTPLNCKKYYMKPRERRSLQFRVHFISVQIVKSCKETKV